MAFVAGDPVANLASTLGHKQACRRNEGWRRGPRVSLRKKRKKKKKKKRERKKEGGKKEEEEENGERKERVREGMYWMRSN